MEEQDTILKKLMEADESEPFDELTTTANIERLLNKEETRYDTNKRNDFKLKW